MEQYEFDDFVSLIREWRDMDDKTLQAKKPDLPYDAQAYMRKVEADPAWQSRDLLEEIAKMASEGRTEHIRMMGFFIMEWMADVIPAYARAFAVDSWAKMVAQDHPDATYAIEMLQRQTGWPPDISDKLAPIFAEEMGAKNPDIRKRAARAMESSIAFIYTKEMWDDHLSKIFRTAAEAHHVDPQEISQTIAKMHDSFRRAPAP